VCGPPGLEREAEKPEVTVQPNLTVQPNVDMEHVVWTSPSTGRKKVTVLPPTVPPTGTTAARTPTTATTAKTAAMTASTSTTATTATTASTAAGEDFDPMLWVKRLQLIGNEGGVSGKVVQEENEERETDPSEPLGVSFRLPMMPTEEDFAGARQDLKMMRSGAGRMRTSLAAWEDFHNGYNDGDDGGEDYDCNNSFDGRLGSFDGEDFHNGYDDDDDGGEDFHNGYDEGDDAQEGIPGIPSLEFVPMNDMDSIRAASRGHRRIMDDAAEAFDQKMFEMAGVAQDAVVVRPASEPLPASLTPADDLWGDV